MKRTPVMLIAILLMISAVAKAFVSNAYAIDAAIVLTQTSSTLGLSAQDKASAKSRLPMLTDINQLPVEAQEILNRGNGAVAPSAYGTQNHPFTTKRATTRHGPANTMKKFPYRAVGKLWMMFGASTFVCTASVINKSLLVTAAHCVWNYGLAGADAVWFEPARHDDKPQYGTFNATVIVVPPVYQLGTDTCTVSGIVCENDLAVIVLDTQDGDYIGDVLGGALNLFKTALNNYSYTSFAGLTATQITQLGYPVAHDGGIIAQRTDSLGYQATPSNVIIGSDQTGGSSGGPWIVNFGVQSQSTSSTPTGNAGNRVMATTSWGFVSNSLKTQGASRFGNNTTYTTTTNIDALVADACTLTPAACY